MTSTASPPPERLPLLATWRRIVVIAVVVSSSISAVIGIVSLLTPSFGPAQGNILWTAALFGAFSVLALCHLALASTPFRVVGGVGLTASAVAVSCALEMIWSPATVGWPEMSRVLAISTILAVTTAHASLLLLLWRRRHPALRGALFVTLTAVGLLAALLIVAFASSFSISGGYMRFVGVVAIIDVLGTLVVPVLGALVKDVRAETSR